MSLLLNSVAEMTLSSSGMQKSQRVCAQANVVRVLHLLLYEVLLFVYTRMLSTIYQYYSKVILVLPIGLTQVFLRTAFPPLHLPPETPTPPLQPPQIYQLGMVTQRQLCLRFSLLYRVPC